MKCNTRCVVTRETFKMIKHSPSNTSRDSMAISTARLDRMVTITVSKYILVKTWDSSFLFNSNKNAWLGLVSYSFNTCNLVIIQKREENIQVQKIKSMSDKLCSWGWN